MAEEIPSLIYFNGKVVPWDEAKVHVWSETAIRATNVFDGVRAYWNESERMWYLVELERHLQRLMQSAHLMRIPHTYDVRYFVNAISDILKSLPYREHMYVRPTIYIEKGRYGFRMEDVVSGMYIVAFPVPQMASEARAQKYCVSSWKRADDLTGTPRIKAGANYQNLRFPRIEASIGGFDDAILLNSQGKVAETSGAAIFIVRGNVVATPPPSAGILESITRSLVIDLIKKEYAIVVQERDIDRTELYISDEVFACGTLLEVAAIVEVDHMKIGNGQVGSLTNKLARRYTEIVLSGAKAPYDWLTPINGNALS